MKYSVRIHTPIVMLFPLAAVTAAYVLPLQNWVQIALLGVVTGVISGFAARKHTTRTFDPADAPIAARRRVVVGFALARLVFGLFLIVLAALLLPDWLAPIFAVLGGYLMGTTAATPIRDDELADPDPATGRK